MINPELFSTELSTEDSFFLRKGMIEFENCSEEQQREMYELALKQYLITNQRCKVAMKEIMLGKDFGDLPS